MISMLTSTNWAEETFSRCNLGDARRTHRLVKLGQLLSSKIGASVVKACDGDLAAIEGNYRLIRNREVKSRDIAEGGFQSTVDKANNSSLLLALEDTTSFNYTHQAEGFEESKGNNGNVRGFYAHSILLVDPLKEKTLGLIEQNRWQRKASQRGRRYNLKNRSYEEKESFKWEVGSEAMSSRLAGKMSEVISVCDREADIYDYLIYKKEQGHRFVVRAVRDRKLFGEDAVISDAINGSSELGKYTIEVGQKSGRKARRGTLMLRTCRVTLRGLKRAGGVLEDLDVNIVSATEVGKIKTGTERLSWVIVTSEEVEDFEKAREVIRYYEMRWRIEEFHKAWKTGAGAEKQRMQTAENLEKMIVVLGFVAVRLLQLREALEINKKQRGKLLEMRCTNVLTREEYITLWFAMQRTKNKKQTLPKKIPDIGWAYESIAKLGGWSNSKRTGKASWLTIWSGWFRLQERLEGYKAAKIMTEM